MKKFYLILFTLVGCSSTNIENTKVLYCEKMVPYKISGIDYKYAEKLVDGELNCSNLNDLIYYHYHPKNGMAISSATLDQIILDNDGIITKKILDPMPDNNLKDYMEDLGNKLRNKIKDN